ncbi:MAG: hypothetical protein KIT31_08135 [Deltaproteobacteria bacterium]|nr:hypothetical protein [Deltaproteobacteria bacterium]
MARLAFVVATLAWSSPARADVTVEPGAPFTAGELTEALAVRGPAPDVTVRVVAPTTVEFALPTAGSASSSGVPAGRRRPGWSRCRSPPSRRAPSCRRPRDRRAGGGRLRRAGQLPGGVVVGAGLGAQGRPEAGGGPRRRHARWGRWRAGRAAAGCSAWRAGPTGRAP